MLCFIQVIDFSLFYFELVLIVDSFQLDSSFLKVGDELRLQFFNDVLVVNLHVFSVAKYAFQFSDEFTDFVHVILLEEGCLLLMRGLLVEPLCHRFLHQVPEFAIFSLKD